MSDGPIECRVRLGADDFVLANHEVHGVPVLPGVTLLDLVWRVLAARGIDVGRVALRDVLFAEPVTVRPGCERELRVTVEEPAAGGAARSVRCESRWLRGGEEPAGWRENARGSLVGCEDPLPRLDVVASRDGRREDMERLYELTRREDIVHGAPMRCRGTLSFGAQGCVAALALEDPRTEDGFHLHPAKMDAATLVAFGQAGPGDDARGFIPFFVERFRAPRPLGPRFHVWVPQAETPAASGDLVRNDFTLHDDDGDALVEVRGMACKRIRHRELITRLVDEVERPAGGEDAVTRHLRSEIGALLGVEPEDVPTDVGFYDLGLDSVAVLRLTESLEELLGAPLYPTLLFEFGDAASVAEHLAAEAPVAAAPRATEARRPAPPGPSPPSRGAAPEVAVLRRDAWVPAPARAAPPADPPPVVVLGAAATLVDDLLARGVRAFAATTPSADVPEGAAYVVAAEDGAEALSALVVELVDRRPRRPVDVIALALPPSTPAQEALGALAATVAAEVPALRCRAVAVDDEAKAAEAVLRELAAGDGEPHVRYRAGRREVVRWVPAALDDADGPGFRRGGRYLIAGAGGIAAALAEHLLRSHSAQVLLVSRGEPAVPAGIAHFRADLGRRDEVEAAVAEARRLFGGLDGVLHCAGESRDAVCFRTTPEDLRAVCAAKVEGTVNLDEATRAEALELFVLFSSLSAALPNPGQSAYAYANAFQYRFARSRSGPGRSVGIAWPLWEDGGMQAPEGATADARRATGMTPLPTATALEVLERAARAGERAFAVVHGEAGRVEALLPAPEADARDDGEAAIAVVGLAGEYPGAPDVAAFWEAIAGGRDCISEVPADRWDRDSGSPGWGGFLDGVDRFDPAFFGISRRDAERMDPQERLFLTTSWRALEDAGHPPGTLAGQPVGVFAGVMWSHYQLHTDPEDGVAPTAIHSAVANRVSYTFDLTGPSLAIDTACSASLTALHLAVESLRRGECTMAIAGGVNVSVHPQKYLQLAQGQFLSDDGRCRSFGEGGTGYVPGEGVGAVVLKPLDRARADGDHVYGVIAATSVNHSGRTSGFTVPSPQAQGALISAALDRAGWEPATVGYVEAHGTGTSLGDPIEIEGLRRAWGDAGSACSIGSVKSNVGHLESAAGIAALTKVLLQLHHRRIAPSLHSERINPHIALEATPFRVQQELAPWPAPAGGGPRRAGVSAFGAGGANAHVLVEEAPPPASHDPGEGAHLFVLSARDEPSLREYARRFADALRGRDDALADLTHTSRVGRTPMATRRAVVARSVAELRAALERYATGAPAGDGGFWSTSGAPRGAGPGAIGDAWRAGRLDEVAAAWVAGVDVEWEAVGRPARRLPLLPPYPFRQERCWIGRWRREEAEPAAAPSEPVELRVLEHGIALVTMRDDAGSNMFTPALMRGLQAAFDDVAARDDVRAVVLAGGERVFSMGATPDALETLAAGGSRFTDAPFVYEGLLRCELPVVAAIRGHASGGGLVFGLYADIVVMSRESLYSANFMKYGFTPGMGATYILERRLGASVANEMLYTGRPFAGEELERRGASVSFAAPDDVVPNALALARSAAEKPSEAVRILKGDLAARVLEQLDGVVEREASMHQRVFGPDAAARIREHFEKVDGFAANGAGAAAAAVEAPGVDDGSVRDVVEAALCASLYLGRDELDPTLSFSEMGLDSIGAVELVREVNRAFGLDLDSVAVYDHPTIPALVDHVNRDLARDRELADAAARPSAAAPRPRPEEPPAGKVALRPLGPPRETPPEPEGDPTPEPEAGPPPEPIAVVGAAGRFPDAPDLAAFWRNLATGRDSVREVPPERWDAGAAFDPDRSAPDRTYSKWAALVDDPHGFDAPLFRISPLEAEAMDPQQRLFLETAWEALEDAGAAGAERRRWGVFAGCASGEYADVLREAGESASAHAFLGNSGSVLAARIAYLLDLTGPAIAIDTACSSSLVAVHLACESIRSGECDAAIAGGVALMLTPRMHVLTSKTGMLSPTGRCAPFDVSADGIVLGEGCGVVVLKPLKRALADGDHVHGVIAGSGVNGDGRTNGLTAPSVASQARLIAAVRERAGVAAEDVTYVEAHGTGTPVGDPIEVKALEEALGSGPPASCGIGSVKGNVGHTTMAAGVAGLLKVLLALRHRSLPPTINFASANPEVDFMAGRLRPVTALEPWGPGPSARLVAGVSSFGFSGTNAHVLVAEPPPATVPAETGGRFVVPVSALDAAALDRTRTRLADFLAAAEPPPPLRDVAHTLAVGRTHFAVRAACVAETVDQLVEQLRAPESPPAGDDEAAGLAAAYLAGETVDWREVWAGRDARRIPLPGYARARHRYGVAAKRREGAPHEQALREAAPPGEGAPREEAVRQAAAPGEAPPGAAAAGWLTAEHVVAGAPTLPGVAAFEPVARAAGRSVPLRLAAVQWLRPIRGEMPAVELDEGPRGTRFSLGGAARGRIEAAEPRDEAIDVAPIADRCPQRVGAAELYAGFGRAGLVYGPSFRALAYVLVGDGEALARVKVPPARASELGPRPLHPVPLDAALQSLAALASGSPGAGPKVPFAVGAVDLLGPLPASGYAHATRDGETFNVRLTDDAGRVRAVFADVVLRPLAASADGLLFVPRWREAAPSAPSVPGRRRVLVLEGPGTAPLARALAERHEQEGDGVVAAPWPDGRGWEAPLAEPDVVYFLACADEPPAPDRSAEAAVVALHRVVRALGGGPVTLKVALPPGAAAATLPGFARAAAAERPGWWAACVELADAVAAPAESAALLHREAGDQPLVRLRDGRRLVRALEAAPPATGATAPALRRGGSYVVVGGAGGIGSELCRRLVRDFDARVAILGRRGEDESIRAQLEQLGDRAIYLPADVADPRALRRALEAVRERHGTIHGAFHAALVLRDRAVARMEEDDLSAVLAPKVSGTVVLGEALCDEPLDFLVFFSSVASFVDAAGQANYAAASTFEDAYAAELRKRCAFPVSVVNWGWWGSVGAVADPLYAERFAALGIGSIEPDEGIAALLEAMRRRLPQAVMAKGTAEGLARLGVGAPKPAAVIEEVTPEVAAAAGDLARSRVAFEELERLAPALLEAELVRRGALEPGTAVDAAALRARLAPALGNERLFDAVVEMLARATRGAGLEAVGDPQLAAHVELLERCVRALPDVLAGRAPATEILFPRGDTSLVQRVYHGHPAADFHHRLLAGEVARAVRAGARRIVEVGAGTGSSSAFCLEACDGDAPPSYAYTDLSPAFVRRGEDAFAARFPFASFAVLDVERDPAEQGFAPHAADVVLATNVLHATRRVDRTLANVRRLLRPGGVLLVDEVTRGSDFVTLTFGLTPGWWSYEDEEARLPGAPLLSVPRWRRALEAAGFGPVRVLGFDDTSDEALEQCVLVAAAPAREAADDDEARRYVRGAFAEVLRFEEHQLDDRSTFENFGVDSIVALDIITRLEERLGPLPSTLLFEHPTIERLAAHLAPLLPPPAAPDGAVRPAPAVSGPARSVAPRDEDVAVVGVVGRYPGAPDLDAFWELLASGGCSVTEVPRDRWDWREQPTKERWGGFLDGIERFDAPFFGILPRDADDIDPQERLFLEASWELLEQTGHLGEHTHEPATGVFVGTMYGSYGQLGATQWAQGRLAGAHSAGWSIANRVSYALDLRGPSFAVDSACSSSLLAVHLACESIRRGECAMAIAGGVNVILHPAHLAALAARNMLARDGRCKTFDARADGMVPGEGVGAVLLKPLRRALDDGDEVWGVLRGGAANAGGKTGGYTVPSPDAQASLVADAVRRAGVEPSSIGYVEAHGTGTALGDPIELVSLARALPGGCAVGSVKANVGHLEGAAGIAGLTKVLLQLRHDAIAPCAGLEEVNPKIDLDTLRLPRALTGWRGSPRRAGVSSFGAGGANVHLIVEEPVASVDRARAPEDAHELFVLSARTPSALRTFAARVASFLGEHDAISLADLCASSQLGRRELPERLAIVARDLGELERGLRAHARDEDAGEAPHVVCATASPTAGDAPRSLLEDRRLVEIARAWAGGARVDWRLLWRGERPRRIAFPPSPFERRRHWLREPGSCRYERPVWEPAPPPSVSARPRTAHVHGHGALATGLREALERDGATCDGESAELLVHVAEDAGAVELVAFLEAVAERLREGDGPLRALFVHVGDDPAHVAVSGALRTLALESSRFSGARVQLDAPQAERVLDELAGDDVEVRVAGGERLVKRLVPFDPPSPGDVVRPHSTYLIAGGGGGLGRRLAEWLASCGPVDVVLAGRSPAPPVGVDGPTAAGANVRYRQADVTREEDVTALVGELVDAPRPLRGVIHAAGVLRDALAVAKSREDVEAVLEPKVRGAELLDAATTDVDLDFFALFSSLAAETGNPGQVDYAAASAYLLAFAEWREALRLRGERRGRTVAFGWPLWQEGGMSVDPATERLFRRRGMAPMRTEAGIEAFRRGIASGEPTVVVVGEGTAAARAPRVAEPRPASAPPPVEDHEPERLRAAVEDELRRVASGFLLVDAVDVDLDDDLIETGFDSISLTELINEVNDAYELDLLPTVLFECSTLRAFARHLVERHAANVAAAVGGPPPAEVAREGAVGETPRVVHEPGDAPRSSDVAVVGMAGILPGSPDLAAFWRHLVAGDDLVTAVPAARAELRADPATAGVRAGFLEAVADFAAEHFGISPAEAALMDPQQRLFLEVAWRAIEDSGHRAEELSGTDTGLFVGVSTTDYGDLLGRDENGTKAHAATGIAHAVLANRVSHILDLRGPSEAIDTACSGSLVAVHHAVRAITAGDCSAAIAGGVNALLSPGLFRAFADSGMLSDGGACRTFDAAADGYVRGEGAGAVLLKPLARALADGDDVHAVIRASAVNHGGHAASLTAPNPVAQAEVLVKAYREAGVDPGTVTAIEAHGTATPLGDPVEVEGMKAAFARLYADRALAPPAEPHVAIGSVKTNVGHLEAAAGIAGLLKTLLALRRGVLPPTIHFAEPNPHLRLDGTPFYVNDEARPWPGVPDEAGRIVRRAGVSSFGFGGTNAHVVLERHPEVDAATPASGPHLLVLSAADERGLRRYRQSIAAFLREHPDLDVGDVAWTLQVGRAAMAERLALVATDRDHAIALLEGGQRLVVEGDLGEAAERWVGGEDVRWEDVWSGPAARRVSLPGVPLPRRTYWFDGRATADPPPPEPARRRPKVALAPLGANGSNGSNGHREAAHRAAAQRNGAREPTNGDGGRSNGAGARSNGRPENGDAVGIVRAKVAEVLGLTTDEVAPDRPFEELGLDSIFRRDVARRLREVLGVELEARDLYDHDSVERLARHIAAEGARGVPEHTAANGSAPAGDVRGLVEDAIGRPIDPDRTFVDNGLTSFDMLRAISALERRFGALKKTLLFDRPMLADLEAALAAPTARARTAARPRAGTGHGATIVRKRDLAAFPELAAALADVDARHAKEGGLAGRDIAPLAFVAPDRGAYLSFSRRGDDVLMWSYVGSKEQFPELTGSWLEFARGHGLRPTFLSMAVLESADGIPVTATPFGAVQRLKDLDGFTLAGRRMNRLRYMVRRFEREGTPRTEPYRPGSDARVDAEIHEVIGRWSAAKHMVNPYVAVVRRELAAGVLADRHRLFLTRLDERLANVVIVTEIPSENGFLLDLEFYPEDVPLGGLEYAIVRIIERLRDEGATSFSFGASFGVSVCESPNASPEVERELEELRSSGLIGDGNFQFKSKFRPVNLPIFLCRPADGEATPVADVILMIADPDATADVPGVLRPPDRADDDLLTDSWAERDDPVIAARERDLRERAPTDGDAADLGRPAWLPHDAIVPTASGRAAEALLCRCWPGRRGVVVHNGFFPTWKLSLADAGFDARAVATAGGDFDLAALDEALGAAEAAFVCVELSSNASGGLPVGLENLRGVRALADRYGAPLVVDATRALDNATPIARAQGRDVWDVARELLGLADAVTMSLSKDFGVSFGGLLATRLPALADRLREHVAMRGHEVGLAGRRLLAAALADEAGVRAQVAARLDAVAALWAPLHAAGLPVGAEPGAHCVLLDPAGVPQLSAAPDPAAACLAQLRERAGVRAAPHLDGAGRVRLAVPVGLPAARAAAVGERVAALWPRAAAVPDDVAAALREGHRPKDENADVLREHGGEGVARQVLALGGWRVEAFVAGDGPPLVLMHPFNVGAGAFARQFAALAGSHRVVCVHQPGVGATTWQEDLTLGGIAAMLAAVLGELGVAGPYHVAGASFGGLVAQAFALANSRETASLTLLGSSYKVGNRQGEVNRLAVVAEEDFGALVADAPEREAEAATLVELLLRCESMDPEIGLTYLDMFAGEPDLLARLPEVAAPALVVQGALDTVIPVKTGHLVHGMLPRARYAEIAGAGHFPFLTHARELHALLVPFLAAHEPAIGAAS